MFSVEELGFIAQLVNAGIEKFVVNAVDVQNVNAILIKIGQAATARQAADKEENEPDSPPND